MIATDMLGKWLEEAKVLPGVIGQDSCANMLIQS